MSATHRNRDRPDRRGLLRRGSLRLALYKRIFISFVAGILLFAAVAALAGGMLIHRSVLSEAQRRVSLDLRSAWGVLGHKLDMLESFVAVLADGRRVTEAFASPEDPALRGALEAARQESGCDFLTLTDRNGQARLRTLAPYHRGDYLANDPFVSGALQGRTVKGIALLGPQRLQAEGGDLEERAFVVFEDTPKAKRRAKTVEEAGMVLVAAVPLTGEDGAVLGTLYAGVLLNRNAALVDEIHAALFENAVSGGQPSGKVTLFLWDTRIATNVMLANGNRAIGTRMSADVYDTVLENGAHWYDRAFVVQDWYLSAYDPIRDIAGKVIGSLYVGVPARQYDEIKWDLWRLYGSLSVLAAAGALTLGLIFARRLTGALRRLAEAAGHIAEGGPYPSVPEPATNDEVRDLTRAFNAMAVTLRDREERLRRSNLALEKANATYLDMLEFVSHELKNTLGVIFTSARALDAGLVGPMNPAQTALVENITRSINTAVVMTRNYLGLARIEKGELVLACKPVDLALQIVQPVLDELRPLVAETRTAVDNRIPSGLTVTVDPELMRFVYKNLLDNALKYGRIPGEIRLEAAVEGDRVRAEVWNAGEGMAVEQLERVFEKFYRIRKDPEATRSTGLGLFIVRDIVQRHGGRIWAESQTGEWARFVVTLPGAGAPAPS
jgi:two-component system NtrC family sensor kinase